MRAYIGSDTVDFSIWIHIYVVSDKAMLRTFFIPELFPVLLHLLCAATNISSPFNVKLLLVMFDVRVLILHLELI